MPKMTGTELIQIVRGGGPISADPRHRIRGASGRAQPDRQPAPAGETIPAGRVKADGLSVYPGCPGASDHGGTLTRLKSLAVEPVSRHV